jgi:ribosomal protein S2
MNEVAEFMESEDFHRLTKKEQLTYKRKFQKAQKMYKGVRKLNAKPDLIIVVDGAYMDSLVKEIQVASIPALILASSDFGRRRDPNYLLMANMNSHKSLDFVLQYILSS